VDDILKQITGQGGAADDSAGSGGLLGGLAGGGLGGVLGGVLGGGAGGAIGGLLSGPLASILPALLPALLGMLGRKSDQGGIGVQQVLDGMHARGLGDVADSWVGTGASKAITPDQAEQALGSDRVDELAAQSGLHRDQVNTGVAAILPDIVNHLTPDGGLPSADSLQQKIGGLLGAIGR
jgi:uncharacterized protein YidB (DUF937 family)